MKIALDTVTKVDLVILEQHLDEKLEKIDEKNRVYRDQILTGLDKVVKELETLREDNVMGTHQTEEMREEIKDHEVRITKLESPLH